jgi:hypothetical protein
MSATIKPITSELRALTEELDALGGGDARIGRTQVSDPPHDPSFRTLGGVFIQRERSSSGHLPRQAPGDKRKGDSLVDFRGSCAPIGGGQAQVVSVDSEAVYLVDPRCPADTPSARSTRRYPVCRLCANTQRLLEPACLCRFRYACPPQVAHTFGSTATQQDLHDGAGAEASPTFHFLSLTQHTCQQRAAHTTADWHTPSHPCTRAPKHAATPKN